MMALRLPHRLDNLKSARLADALAVAVAVSLPWSTSATGILLAIWVLALLPVLDWRAFVRTVFSAAGGLPVLLVLLGIAGMAWADVSWTERWGGLGSFLKLLAIPLLFVQFHTSQRGIAVFAGYLLACTALLVASFALALWPDLPHTSPDFGVMVKNAPSQSGEFAICIGGLVYLAHKALLRRKVVAAAGWSALLLAMLADIVFVATGRTALVIILVLLAVYAVTRLTARGAALVALSVLVLAAIAWFSSAYLRLRVEEVWTDAVVYEQTDARTSSGERIEFAKKSIGFIRTAPLAGHGTGAIHAEFEKAAAGHTGTQGVASANPHNQTFAVGIQLGFIGMVALWAMWIAHLVFFRGAGFAAWIGLLLVVQNIVGSAFNSHLFDFLQGWTYVVGVGVAGGMLLRARTGKAK